MEDFEDVPTYPGSKYDSIAKYTGPILYNETVQEFSANMPNTLKLINSTAKALNNSIIMTKYAKKDAKVGELFYDADTVLGALVAGSFDDQSAKVFIEAIVRMGMISGDLASVELPSALFGCSNSSLAMFLPSADSSLLDSLGNDICSSNKSGNIGFFKALQANLDYTFFGGYFKDLASKASNSSKILGSVASGMSLINDLRSVMDQGFLRKRQIEDITDDFSSLIEDLALFTQEIGQYYDEEKAACLLKSVSDTTNILENFEKCNVTEVYSPMFNLMKEQFPIWKNVLALISSSNEDGNGAIQHCQVDVNRYVYLSNHGSLLASEDLIQCQVNRKRETLDMESVLALLDPSIINENLEEWRMDAFTSMNWTEEALSRLGNMFDHLSDVVSVMQNFPVELMDPANLDDPQVIEIIMSSRASLIITSLKSAVNQTDYFMKNSVLWTNYTEVMSLLGK